MRNVRASRSIDAPAAVVWDVITDHRLYGEIAPNLSHVEVVTDDGVGMVRQCMDTDGNEWTETCTRWKPGRAYAVSVDVEGSGFHRRLFERFEGEWRLDEREHGVRITMQFDFVPRYGPFGVLIAKYLEYRAPPLLEAILDRWEADIRSRLVDGNATGSRMSPARAARTEGDTSR